MASKRQFFLVSSVFAGSIAVGVGLALAQTPGASSSNMGQGNIGTTATLGSDPLPSTLPPASPPQGAAGMPSAGSAPSSMGGSMPLPPMGGPMEAPTVGTSTHTPGSMDDDDNDGAIGTHPRNTKPPVSEIIPFTGAQKFRPGELKAILRTSMGDVTVRLDRVRAPQTVQHFISLALGQKDFVDVKTSKRVRRPFYNDLTFHKVVKKFFVQTGCPFGTGKGDLGPGIEKLKSEYRDDMVFDRPGLMAMTLAQEGTKMVPDTASSQFFISLDSVPEWNDDKYTIFGEVDEGLDVLQKIAAVPVGPTNRPIKKVYLLAVEIFENGKLTTTVQPPASPDSAAPSAPPVPNEVTEPGAVPGAVPAPDSSL